MTECHEDVADATLLEDEVLAAAASAKLLEGEAEAQDVVPDEHGDGAAAVGKPVVLSPESDPLYFAKLAEARTDVFELLRTSSNC